MNIGDSKNATLLLSSDIFLNSAKLCPLLSLGGPGGNSSVEIWCSTDIDNDIILYSQFGFGVVQDDEHFLKHEPLLYVVDELSYRTTMILGKFYNYNQEKRVGGILTAGALLHIETRRVLKRRFSPSIMLGLGFEKGLELSHQILTQLSSHSGQRNLRYVIPV